MRSAFDPRWLIAFVVGFAFSVAYYALLIWAGLWLLRTGIGLIWHG